MIELLIVIVIIGILSVGLVPKVIDAPKRARDTTRKADMKSIQAALTSYYADYNKFPAPKGNGSWPSEILKYFQGGKIPRDPSAPDDNTAPYYLYANPGGCYVVGAILEVANSGNSQKDPSKGGVIDGIKCDEPLKQGDGKFLYVIGGM